MFLILLCWQPESMWSALPGLFTQGVKYYERQRQSETEVLQQLGMTAFPNRTAKPYLYVDDEIKEVKLPLENFCVSV